MSFGVKVYAVLTVDDRLLALKLTRGAAQTFAKKFAPAKVLLMTVDKNPAEAAPDLEQQDGTTRFDAFLDVQV